MFFITNYSWSSFWNAFKLLGNSLILSCLNLKNFLDETQAAFSLQLIILHYGGKTFSASHPMNYELFHSSWWINTIPGHTWMPRTTPSIPFRWVFPPHHQLTHMLILLCLILEGALSALAEFPVGGSLLSQKGTASPCHCGLPRLPAPSPQPRELLGFTWVLPPHTTTWKFFKGSELGDHTATHVCFPS